MKRKVSLMSKKVGLWIDHREAFVVSIPVGDVPVEHVKSGIEDHVHKGGGAPSRNVNGPENKSEGKYQLHLAKYFAEINDMLKGAGEVFIFGPGEAKKELEAYLEEEGSSSLSVKIESADKMTENQIVAKVREFFAPIII